MDQVKCKILSRCNLATMESTSAGDEDVKIDDDKGKGDDNETSSMYDVAAAECGLYLPNLGAVKCDGWDEIMTATSSAGQEEDMDSSIRFLEKEEATNSQGGEREGSKQRVLLRPNPVYPSRQNEAKQDEGKESKDDGPSLRIVGVGMIPEYVQDALRNWNEKRKRGGLVPVQFHFDS
mmetsp:Transcript_18647/g.42610  ORF Transcript_18647/g.42610 Transcript_18647/m.42610 type:complete len:178 (-) Transcript_18647:350-883(-)